MDNIDGINRRDFFRLNDQIYLTKRPIDSKIAHLDPYDDQFNIPKEALFTNKLRSIEAEKQRVTASVNVSDPTTNAYLRTVDQKIDCIVEYMVSMFSTNNEAKTEEVMLSEGGVSFEHEASLVIGQPIHLIITLLPSRACIATIGEVKSNQPVTQSGTTRYRLGVEFSILNETDRKQLSRHIRRKQSLQLRQQRKCGD